MIDPCGTCALAMSMWTTGEGRVCDRCYFNEPSAMQAWQESLECLLPSVSPNRKLKSLGAARPEAYCDPRILVFHSQAPDSTGHKSI